MSQVPLKLNSNKGFSLVELVVVIGIIVGSLGAILGLAVFSLLNSGKVERTAEAVALAEETLEALRNYRDGVPWDLDTFGAGAYYVEKIAGTPPTWDVVAGAETVGIYMRQVEFAILERDGSDNIVSSGTPDPESVEATVTVSWQDRGNTEQIQIVEYLMNWQQL